MDADAWVMIPKLVNKGTECVIDMRPLVLCKNCKHREQITKYCNFNENTRMGKKPDNWFCADGESKDGEQE